MEKGEEAAATTFVDNHLTMPLIAARNGKLCH
jgi:hypothetical protein